MLVLCVGVTVGVFWTLDIVPVGCPLSVRANVLVGSPEIEESEAGARFEEKFLVDVGSVAVSFVVDFAGPVGLDA